MNPTPRKQDAFGSQGDLFEAVRRYMASGEAVNRKSILRATHEYGIEFATAVLFLHFADQLPDALNSTVSSQSFALSDNGPDPAPDGTRAAMAKLVIVPGALYRERPDVGGDGAMLRRPAEEKGWVVDLIPTNGVGRVEENANTIRQWITSRPDEPIILVSLSKGTTDTVAALFGSEEPMHENIVGWVSVSGIPFGTPMVNWMMDRWLFRQVYRFACWIRKASPEAVEDLAFSTDNIQMVAQRDLPFPVYHLAGFPCREHLSCRRARLWYRRFKDDGPTDGVLMLSDLLDLPGIVIPIWGADHYLKTGWDPSDLFERVFVHLSKHNCNSNSDDVKQHRPSHVGPV